MEGGSDLISNSQSLTFRLSDFFEEKIEEIGMHSMSVQCEINFKMKHF